MYSRSLDYALKIKLRAHLPQIAKKVKEEMSYDTMA